ncbi:MAG: DUF721 domain-containing protein [Nitrospirae bacterium YQR-1]
MITTASLFESLSNDLGIQDGFNLQRIKYRWDNIFKGAVADNTQPVFLQNGRLTVNVTSELWLKELHFYKGTIVSKLQDFKLNDIKFRVSQIHEGKRKSDVNANNCPTVLRESDNEYIEEITAVIADLQLRQCFASCIKKAILRDLSKK